jgi:5-deoxy-glucuronate isomerase
MTSPLLRRPAASTGLIHSITPASAGWTHVGFDVHRLSPGDLAAGTASDGEELILVIVEGKAAVTAAGEDWGIMGARLRVFERIAPHALYVPPGASWQATAATDLTLAICRAPASGGLPAQRLGPDGITPTARGTGSNLRMIHNIAMEDRAVAESLLVTEVFTPAGHWSSYPSHRHDEDRYPEITLLEETYYHRLDPAQGFAIQRVYTEDGTLDETMTVRDHDVVLVPRGHHPCGAPHGYDLYYLNVMAGPLRKWRFKPDPAHAWLMD